MLFNLIAVSYLIFAGIFLFACAAVPLNEKMAHKLQTEGLYHITTKKNAESILENGFISSKGIPCYSTFFRSCTFFFSRKPSKALIHWNITNQKDMVLLHVKPTEFKSLKDFNVKFRHLDKSIMVMGTQYKPENIEIIPLNK